MAVKKITVSRTYTDTSYKERTYAVRYQSSLAIPLNFDPNIGFAEVDTTRFSFKFENLDLLGVYLPYIAESSMKYCIN